MTDLNYASLPFPNLRIRRRAQRWVLTTGVTTLMSAALFFRESVKAHDATLILVAGLAVALGFAHILCSFKIRVGSNVAAIVWLGLASVQFLAEIAFLGYFALLAIGFGGGIGAITELFRLDLDGLLFLLQTLLLIVLASSLVFVARYLADNRRYRRPPPE